MANQKGLSCQQTIGLPGFHKFVWQGIDKTFLKSFTGERFLIKLFPKKFVLLAENFSQTIKYFVGNVANQ